MRFFLLLQSIFTAGLAVSGCVPDGVQAIAGGGGDTQGGGGSGGHAHGASGGGSGDMPGMHRWSERYGDAESDTASGLAIDDAGIVVAGVFRGAFSLAGPWFEPGAQGLFVGKLDHSGAPLWSVPFPCDMTQVSLNDSARDLSTGQMALAGRFEGLLQMGTKSIGMPGTKNVYAAKLSAMGEPLWSIVLEGTEHEVDAVNLNAAGDVLVAGSFNGMLALDGACSSQQASAPRDAFVARLTAADGSCVQVGRYGISGRTMFKTIDMSGADMILGGQYDGAVDFGGEPLSTPGDSAFIVRLGPGGEHRWSRSLGDVYQHLEDVATAPDGDIVLVGSFREKMGLDTILNSAGQDDVFVIKLDGQSGEEVWARRFGGALSDSATSVSVDGAGQIVLTGFFHEAIDFGGGAMTARGEQNTFLVKLTAAGEQVWSKAFEQGKQTRASYVAATTSNVVLAGIFDTQVDFGGGVLIDEGMGDVFVASFVP